jgi:dUTP pyrophosphatase
MLYDNTLILEQHGEFIDIKSAEDVEFEAPTVEVDIATGKQIIKFDFKLVDTKMVLILPKYYEAIMPPRSSLYIKKSLIQANSLGVIESNYSGPKDIIKLPLIALAKTEVKKGERLCQMKIQLSQTAPFYIKLLHLFRKPITVSNMVKVDVSHNSNRGGLGSTGN